MVKERSKIEIEGDVPPSSDAPDVCPQCLGTGVVVEGDENGAGYARPCECIGDEMKSDPLRNANIPEQFRHCTLESFKPVGNESLGRARGGAVRYAQLYPNVTMGLMFQGPPGVGKTHLAVGILNTLVKKKGVNCRFVDFADLLIELRSSFNNPEASEEAILKPLHEVDLLLIDDLGAMKISDWTMDILSHVINNRYKSGKTLLVTTNFMDRNADIKTQSLVERIGTPLRSRLYEMCKLVEIVGDDFRKTHKKELWVIKDTTSD
ncbi:MAG: ATP-binding protein, partial [bacterium]|nr:ATP-binding protein [bacterium]